MRKYYSDNRSWYILKKVRERCKETGIECSIDLDDILIPEYCPILGIKITNELGKGQLQSNSSIDRIDPNKGYIKGNVQIISRKANTMKNDASTEELIKFGEWCMTLKENK